MSQFNTNWGDTYNYICTIHDDIRDYSNRIIDLVNIAKDMGINMEHALNKKNNEIDKLKNKIKSLNQENKRLKENIKKRTI
jgi:peptidoglycan hydrolase CwlO-like protein